MRERDSALCIPDGVALQVVQRVWGGGHKTPGDHQLSCVHVSVASWLWWRTAIRAVRADTKLIIIINIYRFAQVRKPIRQYPAMLVQHAVLGKMIRIARMLHQRRGFKHDEDGLSMVGTACVTAPTVCITTTMVGNVRSQLRSHSGVKLVLEPRLELACRTLRNSIERLRSHYSYPTYRQARILCRVRNDRIAVHQPHTHLQVHITGWRELGAHCQAPFIGSMFLLHLYGAVCC